MPDDLFIAHQNHYLPTDKTEGDGILIYSKAEPTLKPGKIVKIRGTASLKTPRGRQCSVFYIHFLLP